MVEIYKQPEGSILSAYNNSVLEFGISTGTAARALVNIGTYTFELTPNQGTFYINIKEMVTLLFNQNAFADTVAVTQPANFLQPDASLYKEVTVEINVIESNGNVQTLTTTYNYLKSVQQIVRPLVEESSVVKVLLPSNTNVKYLTYFEGLPLDVALYSNAARSITLTHVGSGTTTTVNVLKGVNRLFISNGENEDVGFQANMPLYVGLNQIEMYVDATTTITLFINKRTADCGIYLKWFNNSGGWSYWLCKQYYEEKAKTKALDTLNNNFYNLNEAQSGTISLGKENEVERTVSTGFLTEEERLVVAEMFTSPKVYYYHNNVLQPFTLDSYKEVTVGSGSYTLNNTRLRKTEFRPAISMPMQYTQTYGG